MLHNNYKTTFAPLDIDYQTNVSDFDNKFGKRIITVRPRFVKYTFCTLASLAFIWIVIKKFYIDGDSNFLDGFKSKDGLLNGFEEWFPIGLFTITALVCYYRLCSKIELYQYGAVFKTLFRKQAVAYDDFRNIDYQKEIMTINRMRMYAYLLPESIRNTHIYSISTADNKQIVIKSKHYFRLKTRMEHL